MLHDPHAGPRYFKNIYITSNHNKQAVHLLDRNFSGFADMHIGIQSIKSKSVPAQNAPRKHKVLWKTGNTVLYLGSAGLVQQQLRMNPTFGGTPLAVPEQIFSPHQVLQERHRLTMLAMLWLLLQLLHPQSWFLLSAVPLKANTNRVIKVDVRYELNKNIMINKYCAVLHTIVVQFIMQARNIEDR